MCSALLARHWSAACFVVLVIAGRRGNQFKLSCLIADRHLGDVWRRHRTANSSLEPRVSCPRPVPISASVCNFLPETSTLLLLSNRLSVRVIKNRFQLRVPKQTDHLGADWLSASFSFFSGVFVCVIISVCVCVCEWASVLPGYPGEGGGQERRASAHHLNQSDITYLASLDPGKRHLQQMGHIRVESRDTCWKMTDFLLVFKNQLQIRYGRFHANARDPHEGSGWDGRAHVVPMCSWRVEACLICIYLSLNGVLTSTHGHQ